MWWKHEHDHLKSSSCEVIKRMQSKYPTKYSCSLITPPMSHRFPHCTLFYSTIVLAVPKYEVKYYPISILIIHVSGNNYNNRPTADSRDFLVQVRWYTTMIGKKSNAKKLLRTLRQVWGEYHLLTYLPYAVLLCFVAPNVLPRVVLSRVSRFTVDYRLLASCRCT